MLDDFLAVESLLAVLNDHLGFLVTAYYNVTGAYSAKLTMVVCYQGRRATNLGKVKCRLGDGNRIVTAFRSV